MRQVLAALVITRIALAAAILVALSRFAPAQCEFCADRSGNPLLAALTRWDADAYLDIAMNGYVGAGHETNAAYSPLYPALVRVGGFLLGGSTDGFIVAGAVIANVALACAVCALVALATPRIGDRAAIRAAIYILVFPTTVVLSALYAEPLFLALAIASALAADRGRYRTAGLLAGLAAITRPFGALAAIPLAFALWRARATAPRSAWLSLVPAPAAFVAWATYLYAISGDALRFLHVYAAWGAAPRTPLQAFSDLFDARVYGFPWFVLGLFVLFTALVVASWRVAGRDLGALATALLLVLASSGSLTSSMRYQLAIFPAFMTLGALTRHPVPRLLWLMASACVALVFTAMYALWLWVG
jgi:hypothetical protein